MPRFVVLNMDLSVIIVNWNTRDLLKTCLESVLATVRDMAYEIIVVDNGSQDGSVAMLRQLFPGTVVIENAENRGFAAANNQALRIMAGRYALLLNSDAILNENAVRELFLFLEAHPSAAMACGQLLNADGSKQNSIASFPTLLTLMANMPLLEYLFPKQYPSKRYHYREPIEVDSGIGACLLVRKKAVDAVGGLDERYFFFFEETDWAYAMRKSGWKIYHVPTAFIHHLQGQSVGSNFRFRKEFYRSRYLFFGKWHGSAYCAVIAIVIFVRLVINGFLSLAGNVATAGHNKKMRDKLTLYSRLILWHLRRDKNFR